MMIFIEPVQNATVLHLYDRGDAGDRPRHAGHGMVHRHPLGAHRRADRADRDTALTILFIFPYNAELYAGIRDPDH